MPALPLGLLLSMTHAGAVAAGPYDCLLEPTQTVEVGSPVVGLLDKVLVRRGDQVAKGQVVATLESRVETATAALAHYKSNMAAPTRSAENKIEFAKKKFQRRRDMSAQNFMSGQERDEAESEMKLAESELQLAKENKEMAKLEWQQQTSQLSLRTIRSPFNGVVVNQFVYPGEIVEPGGQKKAILKLAQLDPLRVHVILPIAAFAKVKPGLSVDVLPEAPVGGRYVGKVKTVDKVIDAASGTFAVFLEIPNPKLELPAGLKCRAQFPIEIDKPVKR
ncbi:hypothetical protein ASF77_22340 [Massilia sp. Leaf139]|nr:hypothetical protein ASF77_22340 [Massilia sp. Leaf139]